MSEAPKAQCADRAIYAVST